MNYEDYISDAIDLVSAWEDVPEEYFAQVVNDQAKLMTGITPEGTDKLTIKPM